MAPSSKDKSSSPESVDLSDALAGIVPPKPDIEISAGFFHRTLARWLDLPEGRSSGRQAAPVWDYDFWKAELIAEGGDAQRRIFVACIHRGPKAEVERYRYWVSTDAAGRIKKSGWLTAAPRLIEDTAPTAFPAAASPLLTELDAERIAAVFEDQAERA